MSKLEINEADHNLSFDEDNTKIFTSKILLGLISLGLIRLIHVTMTMTRVPSLHGQNY